MINQEEERILKSMHIVLNNNRLAIEAIAFSGKLDKQSFVESVKRDARKLKWLADKLVGNIKEA